MTVFRVEYLPIDLSLAKGECKYQIYKYNIVRETNHFVWAVRVYDDSPRTHTPVKYSRKEFYKYGIFRQRNDAIDKIYKLLYESYLRSKDELEIFYKEYHIKDNYVNKDIWNKQMNRWNHEIVMIRGGESES